MSVKTILQSGLLAAAWLLVVSVPASAYVEAPMSLGAVIAQSSNIVVMRVEKVDKEKNLIIFRKVQDLKGTHPAEVIKHNIGRGGFHPREWQFTMEWAEAGKIAVFFHNGGASETCIHNYWYQAYAGGEWWNLSHAEPYLLRSFAGKPEKLVGIVSGIVAGQEVITPCMVDGDKNALQLRTAKVQRVKASLKIQDYNPQRDFVGWGGSEDLRLVAGMPGFTHYGALNRVDPAASGVVAEDFDGDGKADLCLFGEGKVVLLQNGGTSFNEMSIPYSGGARAAAWADYNGDKKPDLFLATPAGPKLLTNQGGSFKDDTALLPLEPYYNLTAAAWIDQDADGKPDLLLGNGFLGLRLYRNKGKAEVPPGPPPAPQPGKPPAPPQPLYFENVSAKVGLGPAGIGGQVKGDTLTVADVNGDGRADFLYGAGTGMLVLNTVEGFKEAKDSGISYQPGKVAPVFGDFDGDKALDLFVPQKTGAKLFKNIGQGRFADVTSKAGALATLFGPAACACWADFDKTGRPGLFVGCLKGPNRYFRNQGDGTFVDATEAIGLHQRVFNTRGLCVIDLNKDGALDLVLNNEGQESAVLLGSTQRLAQAR